MLIINFDQLNYANGSNISVGDKFDSFNSWRSL